MNQNRNAIKYKKFTCEEGTEREHHFTGNSNELEDAANAEEFPVEGDEVHGWN